MAAQSVVSVAPVESCSFWKEARFTCSSPQPPFPHLTSSKTIAIFSDPDCRTDLFDQPDVYSPLTGQRELLPLSCRVDRTQILRTSRNQNTL